MHAQVATFSSMGYIQAAADALSEGIQRFRSEYPSADLTDTVGLTALLACEGNRRIQ